MLKDSDGDGLSDADERSIHHTSPTMADTDGDGFSDYDEVITKAFDAQSAPLRFNPLVADVPTMEIELASIPWVTLHLTDINGETRTIEVSRTIEQRISEAVTTTETNTIGVQLRDAVTVLEQRSREVSLELDFDPDAGNPLVPGNDVSLPELPLASTVADPVTVILTNGVTASVGRTVEATRSNEVSFSFSTELRREYGEAITVAESYSQTHEIQASGGTMEVLGFIRNRSNVPFQVANLFLTSSVVGADGVELPLTNLEVSPKFSNFQAFTLSPGQEIGPVSFFTNDLTLEQSMVALQDVRIIRIRVGAYELRDEKERPYNFDAPTIRARTAGVNLDYGDLHPPEWYSVATNLDPARAGVNLYRAMTQILRIPFECEPATGRVSVRGLGASEGDNGRWCIFHRHRDDGEDKTIPYCSDEPSFDCNLIELRAGDLVRLSWMPY